MCATLTKNILAYAQSPTKVSMAVNLPPQQKYICFFLIIKVPLLRVKGIARVCEGDPRVTGDLYAPDPDHQACCRLCVWLIAWAIDPWVFKFYLSYFL